MLPVFFRIATTLGSFFSRELSDSLPTDLVSVPDNTAVGLDRRRRRASDSPFALARLRLFAPTGEGDISRLKADGSGRDHEERETTGFLLNIKAVTAPGTSSAPILGSGALNLGGAA